MCLNLLEYTKKKTSRKQATEVLYDASQGHDETPAEDQSADVIAGLVELRQYQIARDLAKDIWYNCGA